jgi:hypothetical protein
MMMMMMMMMMMIRDRERERAKRKREAELKLNTSLSSICLHPRSNPRKIEKGSYGKRFLFRYDAPGVPKSKLLPTRARARPGSGIIRIE